MVQESTREFVFEVLDAQQDLMIKFTIFGLVIFYVFLFWWLGRDMKLDSVLKIIFKFFSRIYIISNIVFFAIIYDYVI